MAFCDTGLPFRSLVPSTNIQPQKVTDAMTCPLGKLLPCGFCLTRTSKGFGRGRLTIRRRARRRRAPVRQVLAAMMASKRRRVFHKAAASAMTSTFKIGALLLLLMAMLAKRRTGALFFCNLREIIISIGSATGLRTNYARSPKRASCTAESTGRNWSRHDMREGGKSFSCVA